MEPHQSLGQGKQNGEADSEWGTRPKQENGFVETEPTAPKVGDAKWSWERYQLEITKERETKCIANPEKWQGTEAG